jgi:alpha-D-ribose 1-methylphosphonate 5-triphosphate synthase subunit PhnH
MTEQAPLLLPGLTAPVFDAQRSFRAAMQAMAEPGRIVPLVTDLQAPAPLSPTMAALLLTLLDFETTLWLDAALAASAAPAYLRFHSGVRIVPEASAAMFVAISDPQAMPALNTLAAGSAERPELSATLLVAVDQIVPEGWHLQGPGIASVAALHASPLPADFSTQWRANSSRFPQGVDVIFVAPGHIACLPRTTRIMEG